MKKGSFFNHRYMAVAVLFVAAVFIIQKSETVYAAEH